MLLNNHVFAAVETKSESTQHKAAIALSGKLSSCGKDLARATECRRWPQAFHMDDSPIAGTCADMQVPQQDSGAKRGRNPGSRPTSRENKSSAGGSFAKAARSIRRSSSPGPSSWLHYYTNHFTNCYAQDGVPAMSLALRIPICKLAGRLAGHSSQFLRV